MNAKTQASICASIAAVGMALAAWPAGAQTGATSASPNQLANAERAANLFGKEILGSDNQKIGKVDNLVVDLESEHILYVIVDDSGRGRVAVVPQIFTSTLGKTLQVNMPKQKLDGAPQFTSSTDSPQQLGQAGFIASVYQYFGVNAWWKGNAAANQGAFNNVHKLNQVIGMTVEDVNNQNIGKISNVVVDMSSGRMVYAVFSPGSSLNLGNNLYAMPSDAFTLGSDGRHLVTGIDRQKLASAPHFANNQWPTLTDPTFASQVYQYYGKQAWFSGGSSNYQPTGR